MSSSDLAVIDPVESSLSRDLADLANLSDSGFLPYLAVASNSSKIVDNEKYYSGDLLLTINDKDNPENHKRNLDLIAYDYRMKAMHLKDKKPQLVSYDFKSKEFADLKALAAVTAFGGADSYMWGAEFLFYAPAARSGQGSWVSYFASSKSARMAVQKDLNPLLVGIVNGVKTIVPCKVTMSTKQIKQTYTYWVPVFSPCAGLLEGPNPDEAKNILTRFLNPPKDQKERATEPERDR